MILMISSWRHGVSGKYMRIRMLADMEGSSMDFVRYPSGKDGFELKIQFSRFERGIENVYRRQLQKYSARDC